jgi:hypothetical protein
MLYGTFDLRSFNLDRLSLIESNDVFSTASGVGSTVILTARGHLVKLLAVLGFPMQLFPPAKCQSSPRRKAHSEGETRTTLLADTAYHM